MADSLSCAVVSDHSVQAAIDQAGTVHCLSGDLSDAGTVAFAIYLAHPVLFRRVLQSFECNLPEAPSTFGLFDPRREKKYRCEESHPALSIVAQVAQFSRHANPSEVVHLAISGAALGDLLWYLVAIVHWLTVCQAIQGSTDKQT